MVSASELMKSLLLIKISASVALLYSTQSLVINTYRLSMERERSTIWTWSSDAFSLQRDSELSANEASHLMTLCLVPTRQISDSLAGSSLSENEPIEDKGRFYQIFSLGPEFDLFHALLTTTSQESHTPYNEAPGFEAVLPSHAHISKVRSSRHVVDDDFVVPDELDDLDEVYGFFPTRAIEGPGVRNPAFATINACRLHKLGFPGTID